MRSRNHRLQVGQVPHQQLFDGGAVFRFGLCDKGLA
jgi:hypothetical protein